MQDLAGKGAFVTGAASGIGLAMARRFVAEDVRVAIVDIEQGALDAAVKELEGAGGQVFGQICDVSKFEDVERAARDAREALGELHIVCNNAGVSPFGSIADSTPDDWRWVVDVNLMGVVHGVLALLPHLKEHGEGGHIVNTSSVLGLVGLSPAGAYSATKYAVVGMSEVLRAELAPDGIGVSVLCPSFVNTRLHESTRNRPSGQAGSDEVPDFIKAAISGGMDTDLLAEKVLEGIRNDATYIVPQADMKSLFDTRIAEIEKVYGA
jgi:NAD(P)-dependent dehydrogenase (short-subunit alcohol dehydrogenase family)